MGQTDLRFGWTSATGPVTGYVVNVSVNDGPLVARVFVDNGTEATISAEYGETIYLTVHAINFVDGVVTTGPQSEVSDSYRFVENAPPPPPPPPPVANPAVPYDFDGDGRADIAVVDEATGETRMWKVDGLVRLEDTLLSDSPPGTAVAAGDFDADGVSDLIWRNAAGVMVVLMMPGRIDAFTTPIELAVSAVGDYDGDGRSDLLMGNPVTGELQFWLLDGASVRQVVGTTGIPPNLGWTLAGTGDLDGDGTGDLVWLHSSGAVVGWFVQNAQVVEQSVIGSIGASAKIAGIGDLNADGQHDLIIRDGADLSAWLLDGSTVLVDGLIKAVSTSWSVTGVRDLDGDGTDDILLSPDSNRVYGYLMDGLTIWDSGPIENTRNDFTIIRNP